MAGGEQQNGDADNAAEHQEPGKRALVLGMGYMNLSLQEGKMRAENPYIRDVKRIENLEALGWHVHSVNMQVSCGQSGIRSL